MATARFWRENPSRYNLAANRCTSCGRVYFPPRSICPQCRRKSLGRMKPMRLKGEGEVYTFSVVHEAPPQLEAQKPYIIAMVKMDEGVMLTSQIIDVDVTTLRIGMRVRTVLRKLGEDGAQGVIYYGYKFMPIE
jgi:uncharacterized OB-fold protein